MKLSAIVLIICQLLFASISMSAHSMEQGHDSHEGLHFHLELKHDHDHSHDHDEEHDADHDNSSHIHFGLDFISDETNRIHPMSSDWLSSSAFSWKSQTHQPPIPPPTA